MAITDCWPDPRTVARAAMITLAAALAAAAGLQPAAVGTVGAPTRIERPISGAGQPVPVAVQLMSGLVLRPTAASRRAQPGPPLGAVVDVSWPQCHRALQLRRPSTVVVGITGGRPERVNPCLRREISWATAVTGSADRVAGYLNVAVPMAAELASRSHSRLVFGCAGSGTTAGHLCRVRRIVAAHVTAAVRDARADGLRAHRVWLDVETANHWVDGAPALNRAVIDESRVTLARLGLPAGIYSTLGMWTRITGHAGAVGRQLPVWEASGTSSRQAAASVCTARLAGALPALVQYEATTSEGAIDVNLPCPSRHNTRS